MQFALLGVDFMLDASGHAWLLEFTKSPGIQMQPAFLGRQNRAMIPEVVLAAGPHCPVGGRLSRPLTSPLPPGPVRICTLVGA